MFSILDYSIGDKLEVKAINDKLFTGIIIDFEYKDEYPEDGITICKRLLCGTRRKMPCSRRAPRRKPRRVQIKHYKKTPFKFKINVKNEY